MIIKFLKKAIWIVCSIIFTMLLLCMPSKFNDQVLANDSNNQQTIPTIENELNLHFFPLGNSVSSSHGNAYSPGDSCIITFNDIQILVDCGATAGSRIQINEKISKVLNKNDLLTSD